MDRFQEINIEKDFWDDFIVEAFEHIDAIESNAMDLEKNPENMDIIHTMFRAFHTIKGLSGFVEHTIIQEVAHKTETMMDLCRKGELRVSTQIVDAILKSSDYIKQLCNDMEAFRDSNLLDNIEALLNTLEQLSNSELFPANQEGSPAPVEEQVHVEEPQAEHQEAWVENPQPTEQHFEQQNQDGFWDANQGNQEQNHQENWENQDNQDNNNSEWNHVPENNEYQENNSNQEQGLDVFAQEIAEFESHGDSLQEHFEISENGNDNNSQVVVEAPPVEEIHHQEQVIQENIDVPQETVQFEFKNKEEKVEQAPQEQEQAAQSAPLSAEELRLKSFQSTVIEKLKGSSPSKDEPKEGAAKHSSANEEYMKVANYKIDHLVDMMGELIINQALIEQYVSLNYADDRQLVANMSGFLRITRELQNLSMSLRMVALKPTFQKLARIARDTIQELKKDVEFVMSGEATEIDRAVAEKLLDPLVHMIKNAISHGIEETPADRVSISKTPRARVELNAYSKRGKIFIEVKDDGKGINPEIVYNKALEKGLIDPNHTYTDAEIKEFIMLPGFSTAKVVDNISGRGVGMDVVKTQIIKLGGKVEIQSALNEGSTFTLEVPVNHAIMNGTIIEMNNQHFVVPTVNVKEFLQPEESQWIFTKSKRTMIKVRDNIIPIVPISTFFKEAVEPDKVPLVMVLELDQELRAIPIVNVINRQEVVVKPVGSEFSHLKYISGMSILGTGKVSLILDIDYLFRKEITE